MRRVKFVGTASRPRYLVTVTALLFLANVGSLAMASHEQEFKHPPFSPGGDELSSENRPFVQKCHAHAEHLITNMKLELTQELVTQSRDWGTVWRADFRFPKQNPSSLPKMNRLMCWELGQEFYFMSSVALVEDPLSPAPKK